MAGLCAIRLDGVLRAEIGGAPVPEGMNIYNSLVTMYRMCVVLDNNEPELDAMWLRTQGLRDYVQLHAQRPLDTKTVQYSRLQAQGPVELVIDSDPETIAKVSALGITAMLFLHPGVTRPEWRPDYDRTPRPWDTIVSHVNKQRAEE